MNQNLHYRHNANVFAIEPKSSVIPLVHDIQVAPTSHDAYKVYNIGWTDVTVALLYGVDEEWHKVVEESKIKPGHTITLDNVGKLFFASGIKISNNTDERAIIHCAKSDGRYPMVVAFERSMCHVDYCRHLKETYTLGVKYIPYNTQKYRAFLNAFWPPEQLSVWDKILNTLLPLLKDDVPKYLPTTVSSFMKNIRQKLEDISKDCDNNACSYSSYMKIIEDLSKFENIIGMTEDYKRKSSFFLLPLYSNFIFLKLAFFALGIVTRTDMKMSHINQSHIENLLKATTTKATEYIKNMCKYHLEHAYSTSPPEDLYNSMMNVRSYMSIHGTQYVLIWEDITLRPSRHMIFFEEVISYSSFFGRQTPNLIREATSRKMCPPLTPRYLGFIYNTLESIVVYFWRSRSSPQFQKIGGMKLTFADFSSYIMGTETMEYEEMKFNGAHIDKLKVTGTGAIDSCTFYMSDGRELFFGTVENDSESEIFELKGHKIVSIFLSSDHFALEGQAANIAVSFSLNQDSYRYFHGVIPNVS